jgi:hypothetical protein
VMLRRKPRGLTSPLDEKQGVKTSALGHLLGTLMHLMQSILCIHRIW